jgi:hypothetical protein
MMTPSGQLIALSVGDTNLTLAVVDIKYHAYTLPFERPEYSTEKQKSAPELDGGIPNFDTTAGGHIFQIFTGCGDETSRPTIPDDVATYDCSASGQAGYTGNTQSGINSILQRFDILHFDVEGTDTYESEIDGALVLSQQHAVLRAQFDQQFAALKQYCSINFLSAAQASTFSYITGTGLTMSGRPLASNLATTFPNCLITSFEPVVTKSFKTGPDSDDPPGQAIYRAFKLEIEQRTIVTASYGTF